MGIDGLGPPQAPQRSKEGLDDEFHDLDFAVQKSRRYHEKLAHFYGFWRDLNKWGTLVSGSGAFLLFFGGADKLAGAISALIALGGLIDLVVSPDKKAQLHNDLRNEFIDLGVELENTARDDLSLRKLKAIRLTIERKEPPCKRLVDLQARNDECRARGYPASMLVPLSATQNWLGYLFTFGIRRLEKWKMSSCVAPLV